MTLIKRDFYSADPSLTQVRWKDAHGGYCHSVKNGDNTWQDVKIKQPFAIDVWRAMYGYEYWNGGRTADLVPVNKDMPEKKEKGREIYSLIIFSPELQFKHELVVQGKAATAALADLFDSLSGIKPTEMPIVQVVAVENGNGSAPVFEIEGLVPRPVGFGETLIDIE